MLIIIFKSGKLMTNIKRQDWKTSMGIFGGSLRVKTFQPNKLPKKFKIQNFTFQNWPHTLRHVQWKPPKYFPGYASDCINLICTKVLPGGPPVSLSFCRGPTFWNIGNMNSVFQFLSFFSGLNDGVPERRTDGKRILYSMLKSSLSSPLFGRFTNDTTARNLRTVISSRNASTASFSVAKPDTAVSKVMWKRND